MMAEIYSSRLRRLPRVSSCSHGPQDMRFKRAKSHSSILFLLEAHFLIIVSSHSIERGDFGKLYR